MKDLTRLIGRVLVLGLILVGSTCVARGAEMNITVGDQHLIYDGRTSAYPSHMPFLYVFGNTLCCSFSQHPDIDSGHPTDALVVSPDGGQTWGAPIRNQDFWFTGGMVELTDGTLWGMHYVPYLSGDTQATCHYWTSPDNGATWARHQGTITFPQKIYDCAPPYGWSSMCFHRTMMLMPDGSLRGTMYGEYDAERGTNRLLWVKSTDSGATWTVESTIAHAPAGMTGPEVCTEPVVARCADGSLLCVSRTGEDHPMAQCRSTDNGLTWSALEKVFDHAAAGITEVQTHGVDPDLCLMSNGVLVLSFGRPGNCHLLFSQDGNGNQWDRYEDVPTPHWPGGTGKCGGYGGVREVSSNRLLVVGEDRNADTGWEGHVIWGAFVDVTKEDWLPEVAGFPRMRIAQRTLEPLLSPQNTWEEVCLSWLTVLRRESGWQMWYESYDSHYVSDNDSILCYATSQDGVHWERPTLGMVEYDGSTNNNILRAGGHHGAAVFLDARAAAAERYKMVYVKSLSPTTEPWMVYGASSADGTNWTWLADPLLARNSDTQTICFRDGDLYRLYCRMWNGALQRQVGYSESSTFGAFSEPEVILSPDGQDPSDMDFYNSAATKLADNLYVMFPSGFYHGDQTVRPHLAVSHDGKNFQRVGREVVLPLGDAGAFDSKSIYVSPGVPGDQPGTYWFYYLGYNVGHNGPYAMAGGIGRFLLVVASLFGDLNHDGVVNALDLQIVIANFGQTVANPGCDARADANADGVVNALDLQIVIANFGQTVP